MCCAPATRASPVAITLRHHSVRPAVEAAETAVSLCRIDAGIRRAPAVVVTVLGSSPSVAHESAGDDPRSGVLHGMTTTPWHHVRDGHGPHLFLVENSFFGPHLFCC